MSMETEIIEWMRQVVAQEDKRDAYRAAETAKVLRDGGRFITWTGGGGGDENRVYDVNTKELLAVTEDTLEAFNAAWQDNWFSDDSLWGAAYDRHPDPDAPADYAFLLNDNYYPERFKEFLAAYDGGGAK